MPKIYCKIRFLSHLTKLFVPNTPHIIEFCSHIRVFTDFYNKKIAEKNESSKSITNKLTFYCLTATYIIQKGLNIALKVIRNGLYG